MFVNRINVTLDLDIGGKKFSIPGGNIKNFELTVTSYGFDARIDWWMVSRVKQSEDELYDPFLTTDLVKATFTVERTFQKVGSESDPLVVVGLVVGRKVRERAFMDVNQGPVLHRWYEVQVQDRAKALWSQHRPNVLYSEQTPKDVFEDNKPEGLKLKYTWKGMATKSSILALALGEPVNPATFYDYVHWLCAENDVGLVFEGKTEQYDIIDTKETPTAETLPFDDVEDIELQVQEPLRFAWAALNTYSEAKTKKKDVKNEDAVKGVRQDVMIRSSVAADLTDTSTALTKLVRTQDPHLKVVFGRYPSITVAPNKLFDFKEDWSTNVHQSKKTYRMYELSIVATAESQNAVDGLDDESNSYELEVVGLFEEKSAKAFHYPDHSRPVWPLIAEGRVVSEVGEKDEGTYQAYSDSDTKIDYYKIYIPLWDKTIIAPYEPYYMPGHYYFPAYKDERVLVAFQYDTAIIQRFLDWRPGARQAKETQGNHLLLGKKEKNETSIQHVFTDSKPVLSILRTSDKDTQFIEVSEGTIYLETKEES